VRSDDRQGKPDVQGDGYLVALSAHQGAFRVGQAGDVPAKLVRQSVTKFAAAYTRDDA
jgi:hypothetical protein